ncbi:type II toxin-antitoxin system RelB/DinJ family antitoxin [Bosea caraganae]|uniref:Type II toxin-antitoxin system RelB/DinJ family antitoxin n=1 Tax=Bosea caraganae TaxID=2763117 RepID=A0A370KZQ2_9HYPH|nr:type II toxin-antitoxin system RelB/DinJ family antitoxin [Bosea caraganae]RDJ20478.1 type II toxin-antitoxin system RelB/DinJ family antitoxin [Bosea caraganae]RDJ29993.1 type II toxin-antitoxin system RelB/DinJ family antitoxin [Bosea caraganae]
MAATTMVHVRVDEEVKDQATDALAAMGLTLSAAVKIFLMRVATEKALPFELRVPNAETVAAMQEAEALVRNRSRRLTSAQDMLDELEEDGKR